MLRFFERFGVALLVLFAWTMPLHAALLVSLSSTPADLSNVPVGAPLSVNVSLSGLPVGDELEQLAATVRFDGGLLGTPLIVAGSIVPNPLDDPLDLLTTADLGLADVTFLTFGLDSQDRIRQNGVFFSFTISTQHVGSGSILLDFVDAQQFNPANPDDPIRPAIDAGASLGVQVVPEPSSMVLSAVALAAILITLMQSSLRFESARKRTWGAR